MAMRGRRPFRIHDRMLASPPGSIAYTFALALTFLLAFSPSA
jgi:hypothetical protein